MASPDINTADFRAAADFLSCCDRVDPEKIGIVGICGWGGMALNAAAINTMYDREGGAGAPPSGLCAYKVLAWKRYAKHFVLWYRGLLASAFRQPDGLSPPVSEDYVGRARISASFGDTRCWDSPVPLV